MKFPWQRPEKSATGSGRLASVPGGEAAQTCSALAQVLERALKCDSPRILDIGPFCGESAVYLADRGARVSVEEFRPPPSQTADDDDGEAPPPPPLRLDQPDAEYHLVLVWETIDFVPPARLAEFGAELNRILVDGGQLLLFSLSRPAERGSEAQRPARYRVVADDRVLREKSAGAPLRRYSHPNREIERALAPLSVQGIHLQRNQIREIRVLKPLPRGVTPRSSPAPG